MKLARVEAPVGAPGRALDGALLSSLAVGEGGRLDPGLIQLIEDPMEEVREARSSSLLALVAGAGLLGVEGGDCRGDSCGVAQLTLPSGLPSDDGGRVVGEGWYACCCGVVERAL